MKRSRFVFKDFKGKEISTYKWEADSSDSKVIIQIAHGMAETALRYERLAEKLVERGYTVYANDHRGHGLTAGNLEDLGYISEDDGFYDMITDMHELTEIIKKENPGKPVVLFGHSMGSFLSQRYLQIYPEELSGLILCGSNGKPKTIVSLGKGLAKMEMKRQGPKEKSDLMNKLSFGSFNKHFEPTRTEFDWLTRDNEEVDKYINDPYCGAVFTTSYYYYFLKGLKDIHKDENVQRTPSDVPIFIISGGEDPVGDYGEGIKNLINLYRDLGVQDLDSKIYEGARHEILNEINREEVMEDVLLWLQRHNFVPR
ncbi:alpha/beta hydrolase [Clostridium amazonitimonense]|uniref:alpha/beta hydrolase n=1 Tax=Clostridium amazonitimonense TaxID=1499689 RepID=UPI000509C780|nr:alpha/beta hydrolase [Clostridium amazonitimonense]